MNGYDKQTMDAFMDVLFVHFADFFFPVLSPLLDILLEGIYVRIFLVPFLKNSSHILSPPPLSVDIPRSCSSTIIPDFFSLSRNISV